jgi:hypothetical protein
VPFDVKDMLSRLPLFTISPAVPLLASPSFPPYVLLIVFLQTLHIRRRIASLPAADWMLHYRPQRIEQGQPNDEYI